MKMGFLLKNNARKGMGEEKECSKRERKRGQKKGVTCKSVWIA